MLKYNKIENFNIMFYLNVNSKCLYIILHFILNISQYYHFNCIFNQVNADLVSIISFYRNIYSSHVLN